MKTNKHPQVRNPFENRKPKRTEINAAKALARAVGAKCYGMMEAREGNANTPKPDDGKRISAP